MVLSLAVIRLHAVSVFRRAFPTALVGVPRIGIESKGLEFGIVAVAAVSATKSTDSVPNANTLFVTPGAAWSLWFCRVAVCH